MKRAGSDGPRCTAFNAWATRLIHAGSRICSSGTIEPFDESGHEVALGLDERHDLRPDADRRGRERRLVLHRAVDPERLGIAPGDPEHVRAARRIHLVVVVRDPTAEHLDAGLLAGPDAGDDRLDVHPTILSRSPECR